jgi:hypothetical protein
MKKLYFLVIISSIISCNSNNDKASKQILTESIEDTSVNVIAQNVTDAIAKTNINMSFEKLVDSILKKNIENEHEYILLRDSLIKIMNADSVIEKTYEGYSELADQDIYERPLFKLDEKSLDKLENALLIFTKNNPLNSSFIEPESSLETLINELGFSKLDAVVTRRDSFDLYVTTNVLFKDHYGIDLGINFNLGSLCDIFQGTLSDAAISGLHSYSINVLENSSPIYIAIVIESQDPYPTQPKRFYALWTIDKYVYILQPKYPKYLSFQECPDLADSLFNSSKIEDNIYQLYFAECCLEDPTGKQQVALSESIIKEIFGKIEAEKAVASNGEQQP